MDKEPSTLCLQCQDVITKLPQSGEENRYLFPTGYARSFDCAMCDTIFDQVPVAFQKKSISHIQLEQMGYRPGYMGDNPFAYFLLFNFPYVNGKGCNSKLRLYDEEHYTVRQGIEGSTCSEAGWRIARQWLSTCRNDHHCEDTDRHRLPTRLVHVRNDGDGIKMRLRASDDLATDQEYCTLSHCWGLGHLTKLERHSMRDFQKNIPITIVSRTFQHAALIALNLGFEYVWIDALCIVQDDQDDWQTEAAIMAEIYAGSSLNIAATAASSGEEGCFYPRSAEVVRKISPRRIRVEDKIYSCVANQDDLWQEDVEMSPLSRRGWVLQERVLAPRILHFGRSQLYWECREINSYETLPEGAHCGQQNPTRAKASHLTADGGDQFWWEDIVSDYSRKSLTREEDKLVAISALASRYQAETGDRYVAGLWREQLERQLLWTVDEDAEGSPALERLRPAEYIAPTWSWASLLRPVGPNNIPVDSGLYTGSTISILGVQIATRSQNIFGQVSSASLLIRCRQLKKALLRDGSYHLDINMKMLEDLSPILGKPENPGNMVEYSSIFDAEPPEIPENIYMMSLLEDADTNEWISGLLLESTGLCGEYRRVGFFKIEVKKAAGPKLSEFVGSLPVGCDNDLYAEVVQPDKRGCNCIITLI